MDTWPKVQSSFQQLSNAHDNGLFIAPEYLHSPRPSTAALEPLDTHMMHPDIDFNLYIHSAGFYSGFIDEL